MVRIPLNQVKDELSHYLRLAETESIIITRHGVPAGMLVGFEDPEGWWICPHGECNAEIAVEDRREDALSLPPGV